MAVAVATATITLVDNTQKVERVFGTLAVDADPKTYVAGGIACSLAGFDDIKSASIPIDVRVKSKKATAAEYIYKYVPGASLAAGLLQIFVQDAVATNPLLEMAAGAVPAGVSGDTIAFEAVFQRL